MTLPDPVITADPALISRVREATKSNRTLGTAIRDGAAVLGVEIRWHEADVLAEAVRHHFDGEIYVFRMLGRHVSLEWFREHELDHLVRDLVADAHEQGYALVEEPIETVHACPDFADVQRKGPAWTEDQVDRYVTAHPDHFKTVVLTGRVRKLGKAS